MGDRIWNYSYYIRSCGDVRITARTIIINDYFSIVLSADYKRLQKSKVKKLEINGLKL